MTASPSPRAPVTARSPRSMIAAFSRAISVIVVAQTVHVVEIDVGHDRHAAVPGVRRVETATETDLHERDVRPDLGEAGEHDRGQQLEFGRVAVPGRDLVGRIAGPGRPAGRSRPRRSGGHRSGSARDRSRGAAWAWIRPCSRRLATRHSASASTLPLPLVPAISAPRTARSGWPSSRSSARVRPSPSLMPKRPRSASARSAPS